MVRLCRSRGILTIEDCASALGASSPEYPVGKTRGLYPLQYLAAKIVEVGYGGSWPARPIPWTGSPLWKRNCPFYGPAVERTERPSSAGFTGCCTQ